MGPNLRKLQKLWQLPCLTLTQLAAHTLRTKLTQANQHRKEWMTVLTAASQLTSPSHPRILLVRISYSISLSLRISIHEFWNTQHTTITATMTAEHFTSFFLLPPLVFWSQGQTQWRQNISLLSSFFRLLFFLSQAQSQWRRNISLLFSIFRLLFSDHKDSHNEGRTFHFFFPSSTSCFWITRTVPYVCMKLSSPPPVEGCQLLYLCRISLVVIEVLQCNGGLHQYHSSQKSGI